jgi:DNA-binding GntR family transcriptional regulator
MGDRLLSMIKSGRYPVGSNLPTEIELSAAYAVSRHTVREAIRRLQELGLVERRPRAGTTIIRQHPEPQFGVALDTTDQLKHYLETTDLHVVRVVDGLTRQPTEAKLEGDPADWLKVETHRNVPGSRRAISWTDIYLRKEYRAIVKQIATRPGGVYPLFEEFCGEIVETIEVEISAATFPPRVAKLLGYGKADPALLMIRRFRNSAGKLLEVAVSYYPPYEFRYLARLTRAQGRHQAQPKTKGSR